MQAVALLAVALALSTCAPAPQTQPFKPLWRFSGPLPKNTFLDLAGTFTFYSGSGKLVLSLDQPCRHMLPDVARGFPLECDQQQLDTIIVTAVTPWRQVVAGRWNGASNIAFRVDWTQTGLDPLPADIADLVALPWTISGALWTPTRDQAARLLKLISTPQNELDLVRGGAAPRLEVATFEIVEGELRAGAHSTLRVRLVNHGPGVAYQVAVTVRSSLASAHGLRLELGMIAAGAERTRTLRLNIPIAEAARSAMLVLEVGEGNGFVPSNVSRRFAVVTVGEVPVLDMQCGFVGGVGGVGESADLRAGEHVVLRCNVDNRGSVDAKVALEAAITGYAPIESPARDIAARARTSFDVPITIPRNLSLDSRVEILIVATDSVYARTAEATVVGVVRKPQLCSVGHLTRRQYQAKLAELQAMMVAGDLTQAQLDRYEAELITCLR